MTASLGVGVKREGGAATAQERPFRRGGYRRRGGGAAARSTKVSVGPPLAGFKRGTADE